MPLSQRAPQPPGSSACRRHGFAFEQVLGTTLELTVIGPRARAETACDAVLAEVDRLEAVFSRFQPESDLRRWLRNEPAEPASELFDLLRRAERWTDRTGGAFHPGAQAFGQLWAETERRGVAPDADALAGLTASLRADFASGPPPAHAFALDAIAKRRIVDAGMEFAISFELVRPRSGNYYRPYVAVWLSNADGVPVRTLAFWVQQSSSRYSSELRRWFIDEGTRQSLYGGDLVATVSSATRPAGRYLVVWDGLDDQGEPAPAGDYLLNIESSRQQGYYVLLREPVTLGAEPFAATFPGSRDVGEFEVAYRRRA